MATCLDGVVKGVCDSENSGLGKWKLGLGVCQGGGPCQRHCCAGVQYYVAYCADLQSCIKASAKAWAEKMRTLPR